MEDFVFSIPKHVNRLIELTTTTTRLYSISLYKKEKKTVDIAQSTWNNKFNKEIETKLKTYSSMGYLAEAK